MDDHAPPPPPAEDPDGLSPPLRRIRTRRRTTVRGDDPAVTEMPLFPLNVVLFPQMPLPLHVFEERYKEMVNRCIHEGIPFGVVLITEGAAEKARTAPAGTRTCSVGCAARIAHVERLADGRMNILVVGETRFRILDTHEHCSYRTGITATITDADTPDHDALPPLTTEVQKLLRDFLTRSLALAGEKLDTLDLPDDPEPLSFTVACVLPIELNEKQELLEATDTAARLACERDILLREVARLRRAAAARAPEPVTASRYAALRSRN